MFQGNYSRRTRVIRFTASRYSLGVSIYYERGAEPFNLFFFVRLIKLTRYARSRWLIFPLQSPHLVGSNFPRGKKIRPRGLAATKFHAVQLVANHSTWPSIIRRLSPGLIRPVNSSYPVIIGDSAAGFSSVAARFSSFRGHRFQTTIRNAAFERGNNQSDLWLKYLFSLVVSWRRYLFRLEMFSLQGMYRVERKVRPWLS